jgi:SAM-dependent methyltransferase
MTYDAARTAAYYDEYGEREWTRFEDGRTPAVSADVHTHYLRRFVRAGDRVLDGGAGPGRFTIELARIGAEIVVADLSPRQLELNRERLSEAGLDGRVVGRVVADACDLSHFAARSFDATVCYGGPLSYVLDRAPEALAELIRVTRPGGHLLVSVMSLVGALLSEREAVLEVMRRDGPGPMEEIVRTGYLPDAPDYGHLPMRLFRWSELERKLAPHGEIVAASAAGLLGAFDPTEPELREALARVELELAAEPGAIDCGPHIVAVVEVPRVEVPR